MTCPKAPVSVPFCEARARGHGRLSHVLCFRRFICLGGSTVPSPSDGTHGYRCPPGFRCPPGAHSELPCAPGTFSPVSGADACLPCPAGTYCPKAATVEPTTCPKGDERPQGSGQMGSSSPGAAPGTMCHRRGRGPAPETGLVAPQREVRGGCRGSHWGQVPAPSLHPVRDYTSVPSCAPEFSVGAQEARVHVSWRGDTGLGLGTSRSVPAPT